MTITGAEALGRNRRCSAVSAGADRLAPGESVGATAFARRCGTETTPPAIRALLAHRIARRGRGAGA